ncbi:hypothetical protein CK503_06205 [Aliifodinibius salipaludis]|uniref:Uncharacterized protein n=1 Tax=Fodinibius salipaludis TaxID=2032627 RepID=A0A2A2G9X8_9BACT|nr:hypothetical protein CK503_06205 [Aliifodinibius salipaludis]
MLFNLKWRAIMTTLGKNFKQRMVQDSVYEDRHFRKVDVAYEYFLEQITEAELQLPASVDQVR